MGGESPRLNYHFDSLIENAQKIKASTGSLNHALLTGPHSKKACRSSSFNFRRGPIAEPGGHDGPTRNPRSSRKSRYRPALRIPRPKNANRGAPVANRGPGLRPLRVRGN